MRWEIERDVIRGRRFDYTRTFLPDGLSLVNELPFLGEADQRVLSQVQGRTYANIFGLVERFISAKMLDISRDHWLGDQVAFEALVRLTDEELKHQELFRRLEAMMAADMPAGYVCTAEPNAVAPAVLGKRTWAVLALTLHIELFVAAHYRASIEPQDNLSDRCGRTSSCSTGRTSRSTRCSTSWSGARGREARRGRSATPRSTT